MPSSTSLTGLIARVSRLYKATVNTTLNRLGFDLSSEMCGVLIELWKNDSQFLQDFADNLKKDKGGMTKIVNSLEKRKLVIRVTDKTDKRRKKIILTKKGKALKSELGPVIIDIRAQALQGISPKVREEFEEALYQITNNLEAINPEV